MKIQQILNRIIWDENLNPSEFALEYYDRNLDKNLEIPFTSISHITQGYFFTDSGQIPIHRIRRILWKGIVYYDREYDKNIRERIAREIEERFPEKLRLKWDYLPVKIDGIKYDERKLELVSPGEIEKEKRLILARRAKPMILARYFLLVGYARYLAYKSLGVNEIFAYLGL